MKRFILASAASFETDEIVLGLSNRLTDFTRIITGVGVTESAMIAARTSSLVADRDVIFCCTAGSIGRFETIEIFSASSVRLGSWDVRNLKTEILSDFDRSFNLKPLELGLNNCHVVCSLGVSVASDNVQYPDGFFDAGGPVVESIELYAVARAWLPVARSFTAIVATTNETGAHARAQWQSNFRRAASDTASFLLQALPHAVQLKEI